MNERAPGGARASAWRPPAVPASSLDGLPPPRERLDRRPRPVGGQIESARRAAEPLAPVGELPLQDLALEPAALPGRVVGVLHGQLGQRARRRRKRRRASCSRTERRATSRRRRCGASSPSARGRPPPGAAGSSAGAARRSGMNGRRASSSIHRPAAAAGSSRPRQIGDGEIHRSRPRRSPAPAGRRPRRRWCAATRGGGRSRPGRGRAPRGRARPGGAGPAACCRRGSRASSWSRNQSRCCAKEQGIAACRGTRHDRRRQEPLGRTPAASTAAASPATVGSSKTVRSGQVHAERLAQPGDEPGWRAASGRRDRRSSRADPRGRGAAARPRPRPPPPRTGCAAPPGPRRAPAPGPSRASARRSTLPLTLSGSASRTTNAGGTMWSGSDSRRNALSSSGVAGRSSAAYATSRRLPGSSSCTSTTHSRTAGWRARAASISPGSMRKPRIFT